MYVPSEEEEEGAGAAPKVAPAPAEAPPNTKEGVEVPLGAPVWDPKPCVAGDVAVIACDMWGYTGMCEDT
jgi:hypothetical protein